MDATNIVKVINNWTDMSLTRLINAVRLFRAFINKSDKSDKPESESKHAAGAEHTASSIPDGTANASGKAKRNLSFSRQRILIASVIAAVAILAVVVWFAVHAYSGGDTGGGISSQGDWSSKEIASVVEMKSTIRNTTTFVKKINYTDGSMSEMQILPAKVKVGSVVGLDTGRELLTFGIVVPGGDSTRTVVLQNQEEDARVVISLSGEIAPFITIRENNLLLESGAKVEIPITLAVPTGTPRGDYSGNVTFEFRRPA